MQMVPSQACFLTNPAFFPSPLLIFPTHFNSLHTDNASSSHMHGLLYLFTWLPIHYRTSVNVTNMFPLVLSLSFFQGSLGPETALCRQWLVQKKMNSTVSFKPWGTWGFEDRGSHKSVTWRKILPKGCGQKGTHVLLLVFQQTGPFL